MRIELDASRFDGGVGDFEIGHVFFDTQAEREVQIVKFSGYTEIDDDEGVSYETVNVHFGGTNGEVVNGLIEYDDLERAIYTHQTIKPIAPKWFVDEVNAELDGTAEAEAEARRAKEVRDAEKRFIANIRNKAERRDVEHWSDTELFAKVSGAPLALAESVLVSYENNLARMANSTPKQLQLIGKLTEKRSEKIAAAFELGKRLARFHAERPKITSPSDVADLMMSKLRYLQKEIVVVLALDTKGGVTTTGKAGEIAEDLKWGKLIAEETVFTGTLNASVFHPREIFRFAIQESANSIILCHNHPSGDPQPSQEDIKATKQLIEAGNNIGIKVLDHIIIGDGIFASLKEEGFI
ncbi:hypothetical protein J5I95_13775 [Candidatus Poribacteria bacterium]|nr:hypothetical protein [Candidatus Poribacteria bacterium]